MRANNLSMELENIVTAQLTCLEQHLDSKDEVREKILDAFNAEISTRTQQLIKVEELPLGMLQKLNNELGVCFEIHDGRVTEVFVEINVAPRGNGKSARGLNEIIRHDVRCRCSTPLFGEMNI